MRWDADKLDEGAVACSASRRTDVPAFYGAWFLNRLDAGVVEYIPAGPPRRVRRSMLPADITHFCLWSKNPAPFMPVLEEVRKRGFPVLWNVTITSLGGTRVERNVPPADRVVESVKELARRLTPAAILWRFDPIFLSEKYPAEHLFSRFDRLCGELAGHVDRVATSFLESFAHVAPNLCEYEKSAMDRLLKPTLTEQIELAQQLRKIAEKHAIPFSLCCSPDAREQLPLCPCAGCDSWEWACRIYPVLRRHRPLRAKPTRDDCGCCEEFDIGAYQTCMGSCVYSYGTSDREAALRNHARHNPAAPCIIA